LFSAIIYNPIAKSAAKYMELISVVVESTVHGVGSRNQLIADPHLTYFLAFFARTARMAMRNWKIKPHIAIDDSLPDMAPEPDGYPGTPLDDTLQDAFTLEF
jgi:hypothetical protein